MVVNKFKRLFIHFLSPLWVVRKKFPILELRKLEEFIAISEKKHFGQIKFVIESNFSMNQIFNCLTPRQRALEWFGKLGIWDTEKNTGVLIYISYSDKTIEIIADRGLNKLVDKAFFDDICILMSKSFKEQQYIQGLSEGLKLINVILIKNFPKQENLFSNNEISNDIVMK